MSGRGGDRAPDAPTDFDGVETDRIEDGASAGSKVYLLVHLPDRDVVKLLEEGAEVTVGRSPEATFSVSDSTVSRLHTRIRWNGGAVIVEDLGSRNGTWVNGHRIRSSDRRVVGGDVIKAGPVEIVLAETAGERRVGKASPERGPAIDADDAGVEGIVVADPGMQKVFQVARRLAQTQTTVLILGETGVGKEVVAEQIHRSSARKDAAFVRLNCASIPESLLEGELFGHERGAFTGADRKKVGYLEAAHQGTLFLDEIGEMSLSTQVKLLTVLESRKVMRIGGREDIPIDVRIICATNRDLGAEVAAGRFREDLYYRINTFTLKVPPLRERPAEITLLADLFSRRFARQMNGIEPRISIDREAAQLLSAHTWPGNVRELRNAIEHAVVLAEDGVIRAEHLPASVQGDSRAPAPALAAPAREGAAGLDDQLSDVEKKAIEDALESEGGNQTRAAKRLGITRRALLYRLEKLGIKTKR